MVDESLEQRGIHIVPEDFKYRDMIRIIYEGQLVKNGADKIWMYNTFNNEWKTAKEVEMKKK